jgi:hypothetical protein
MFLSDFVLNETELVKCDLMLNENLKIITALSKHFNLCF